ncbi:MAG: SH3 domain-containing protein [Haliscomenobacter sp.]|nr:SH3 domain-containing protein [Haliscomenobacter sp.]
MPFGICPFSVIPVRSMPSHRSELLSQLLFGELFEILETKGRQWYRVRCSNDHFVGWIEQAQCKLITPGEFEQYRDNFAYSLELVQAVMGPDHFIPVTMGARLPNFDGLHFRFGDLVYTFSGQALTTGDIRPGADFLLKIAKRYLSTPFLWGGRSHLEWMPRVLFNSFTNLPVSICPGKRKLKSILGKSSILLKRRSLATWLFLKIKPEKLCT